MGDKRVKFLNRINIIFVIIVFVILYIILNLNTIIQKFEKVDDWKYIGATSIRDSVISSMDQSVGGAISKSASLVQNESIGFSVGGAKDINNFRSNIDNNYLPISNDITYNGLFYEYMFDTGKKVESIDLFSPSYSKAISKDIVSDKMEYYLTVGLNSNIDINDFSRKKLNLVILLDISSSMSSTLKSYYYDESSKTEDKETNEVKSKMKIANESVNILIDQLNEDDRFGIVLFDDNGYLGKPISLVEKTNVDAIKKHVLEISPSGGTNFEAGYVKALELFENYKNIDINEYENRIIVITDAMPNYGATAKTDLLNYMRESANENIYTTFIGVGVDFNADLIEKISNVRGANYYSVHNEDEFKKQVGEQFDYMVTPLVFDLNLNFESDEYEIVHVYGSDTVNKLSGNIININTLFPSKSENISEVKGGVILLKLNKKNLVKDNKIKLTVSYKDREGNQFVNNEIIIFNNDENEYYENNGIRKAIVLARYVNVLKNWILYERSNDDRFIISAESGIKDFDLIDKQIYVILGENERKSISLIVSDEYREIFNKLKEYIVEENKIINDENINREIKLLDKLIINK